MPRRIVTLTLGYVALITCMTSGWHTWPIGVGLGFWVAGFRIVEDHLKLSDRDLEALLRG